MPESRDLNRGGFKSGQECTDGAEGKGPLHILGRESQPVN